MSTQKRKRSNRDDGDDISSAAKQLQATSSLLKYLPRESDYTKHYRALHIDSTESRETTLRSIIGREIPPPSAPPMPLNINGDTSTRLRHISASYVEWAQAEEKNEIFVKHLNAFRKLVRISMCQVLREQGFELKELVKYAPRGQNGLSISETYLKRLLNGAAWSHRWIDELSQSGWGEMAFDLPFLLGATPSLYDKAYCADSNATSRQITQALILRTPPTPWFDNARAFYMPNVLFEIFEQIFSMCHIESALGYRRAGVCKCGSCPHDGIAIDKESYSNRTTGTTDTPHDSQERWPVTSVPCPTPVARDTASENSHESEPPNHLRQTQTNVERYHSFSLGIRSEEALTSILDRVLKDVVESKQWQKEEAALANTTACVTVIVSEVPGEDVTLSFRIGQPAGASLIQELNMQLGSSLLG